MRITDMVPNGLTGLASPICTQLDRTRHVEEASARALVISCATGAPNGQDGIHELLHKTFVALDRFGQRRKRRSGMRAHPQNQSFGSW
jgi:hypothetical protein